MEIFEASAAQLVHWVRRHPILGLVVETLEDEVPDLKAALQAVVEQVRSGQRAERISLTYSATTSREHAAVCWSIVGSVADLTGSAGQFQAGAVIAFAEFLRMGAPTPKVDEAIEVLRDVAFDSVFEFLDESLDARNAVYGLLRKYKQRCEWFWRERLRGYVDQGLENRKGERALAVDLYDYVLGQGVDFSIEPASSGGRADLVLVEPEGRHLVIEAKHVPESAPPSKIKAVIAEGCHQVHRYCRDFSEPAGFLVVFLGTSKRVSLPVAYQDGFPAVEIAGTTVYCMMISIADEGPASKGGRAEEIVVSHDDLKLTRATPGDRPD